MSTTLTRDEVYQRVEEVLCEALGVEPDEVTRDATLTRRTAELSTTELCTADGEED